jgi:hypothetical protein
VKLPPDTDTRELSAALRPLAALVGAPPVLLMLPVKVPLATDTRELSAALRPLAVLVLEPPLVMLPVRLAPLLMTRLVSTTLTADRLPPEDEEAVTLPPALKITTVLFEISTRTLMGDVTVWVLPSLKRTWA